MLLDENKPTIITVGDGFKSLHLENQRVVITYYKHGFKDRWTRKAIKQLLKERREKLEQKTCH
jgi:hypothetical protein